MGIYEWILFGIMIAVVVAGFVGVWAAEAVKYKKISAQINRAQLTVRMYRPTEIFLLVLGVGTFFGGSFTIVYCSIKIEPAPKAIYAFVIVALALVSLLCFYAFLGCRYYVRAAGKDGVLVFCIFTKTKFYRYEEISRINKVTVYRGRQIFAAFGKKGEKLFSIMTGRDKGALKMVEFLQARISGRSADEIFTL